MKSILLTGSLRSPPFGGCATTFPPQAGALQPVLNLESLMKKLPHGALFCHRLRGKSREAGKRECLSDARQGGCKGFCRQRRHKKWRRRRPTSPAQRYYITPEGESPQPVREASAGPGQNPWRPGPKARRRHQPSRRSRVNLREYWKAPPRSRSRSRPRPQGAPSPFPLK